MEGSGQEETGEILETVEETIETEDIDQTGDIAVTADEPSNQIKPENIDKCDKCLKSTFRYRHDGFCGKCVANNIIDVNEQQRLNDAMRCKKCRKPKFRSRHLLFCSDTCPDQPTTPATTTTTTTTTTTMTTTTITTSTSTTIASTTNPIVEKYGVKTLHTAAAPELTQLVLERLRRRQEKQQRKEEKRKEKERRRREKLKLKGQLVTPSTPELGPLGNMLKHIILANTWQ